MDKHSHLFQLKNIPWADKIGYGTGNFGFGIVYQVIAAYLVFYSTAVLGIHGSLVGIAVSIGVIWDGITDPLMGYFSDITRLKKFGRRHLYLIIGAIGTFASNYVLWIIRPELSMHLKFLWILVDLLVIKTFMTIYATPYTALGAEMSSDYNERTTIQGVKMIFFLLGLFFATVMGMFLFFKPTTAYPVGQLNPDAYSGIGLASSVIMLISGLVCYFSTKKYIPYLPEAIVDNKGKGKIKDMIGSFAEAFKNRDYKFVVIAYLFTNIASSLASTLGLHVFTYTFKLDNNSIAFIIGVQFFMSIISQPIWIWISKKMDKKPSVMLGLVISIIGCAVFIILVMFRNSVSGNYLYMIPYAVLVGFGTGGLFSIPISMIADTIDVEELNTGVRSEGIYYGCLTLSYKISQSIAVFLLGVLLDVVKFDAALPVQPESTVIILGLIMPVGSILVFVGALAATVKYSLNREKVAEIQKMLISDEGESAQAG